MSVYCVVLYNIIIKHEEITYVEKTFIFWSIFMRSGLFTPQKLQKRISSQSEVLRHNKKQLWTLFLNFTFSFYETKMLILAQNRNFGPKKENSRYYIPLAYENSMFLIYQFKDEMLTFVSFSRFKQKEGSPSYHSSFSAFFQARS